MSFWIGGEPGRQSAFLTMRDSRMRRVAETVRPTRTSFSEASAASRSPMRTCSIEI